MKRTLAVAALGAAVWFGASVPAQPAGACSIFCPSGEADLVLVEVRLVERAPDARTPAVPPEWSETGVFNAWGSLWFDDGGWLYSSPLEGGE